MPAVAAQKRRSYEEGVTTLGRSSFFFNSSVAAFRWCPLPFKGRAGVGMGVGAGTSRYLLLTSPSAMPAMMVFWMLEVPSTVRSDMESRSQRSAGYSVEKP